jgi:hypothetical protein
MHRIRISVDLPDESYLAYESEGRRRGTTVEHLVEQTVQQLLKELDEEETEGTDHPIIAS